MSKALQYVLLAAVLVLVHFAGSVDGRRDGELKCWREVRDMVASSPT